MGATPPIDYDSLGHRDEKIANGTPLLREQAREWLHATARRQSSPARMQLRLVVRDRLQIVVIDLAADENAQEIFETLNARGTPLTAADLIKNFVFQRLSDTSGSRSRRRTASIGRSSKPASGKRRSALVALRYPRSSIFLNHWLVARTGEEVVAREVFNRFKKYADYDAGNPMAELVSEVPSCAASRVYRGFIEDAARRTGAVSRLGLFGYRTGVLESEVIKPLLLCLFDPQLPAVPEAQWRKALDVIESWMVRRALVRATTKRYNYVIAEVVSLVLNADRNTVGHR